MSEVICGQAASGRPQHNPPFRFGVRSLGGGVEVVVVNWHLRDFVAEDLEQAVRLDEVSSTTAESPLFALSDVVAALSERHPAVVAVSEGHLVGTAVSRVDGDRAWILRLALHPDWRGRGLGS